MKAEKYFTKGLIKWNKYENKREMPWKNEKDPYKIWISEIILQQTRVNQGLGYYNRFIERFPTAKSIAIAPETTVFKLWEGLGYYTRCKNVIASAKHISNDLRGKFPTTYEEILRLKGIGSYTASAIASFAYNLPHAVVDGNVYRVLSRFFGIWIPVDSLEGKRYFNHLAYSLLDKKEPGIYNQAIMDFGATICKPAPLCGVCPLNSRCEARLQGLQRELPVKEKVITRRHRWFYYLVVKYRGKIYIRRRETSDIWQNLYEFILLEMPKKSTVKNIQATPEFIRLLRGKKFIIDKISKDYTQQLTHQTITGLFIDITVNSPLELPGYELASPGKIKQLPFPKFITTYLKD